MWVCWEWKARVLKSKVYPKATSVEEYVDWTAVRLKSNFGWYFLVYPSLFNQGFVPVPYKSVSVGVHVCVF